MQSNWGYSKHFEGLMDGFFLMAYALGLFTSGVIGDKFDTAKFHAFGLFMTSFIYILFAISVPYLKLNVNDYQPYYIILWIINGLIQSIGWPTGVKLIGNWFTYSNPYERRQWFIFKGYDSIGLIFGLWAAHQYMGNIIGIGYVSLVEHYKWKTEVSFYLPAIQAFFIAFWVLYLVQTYPSNSVKQTNTLTVENINALDQSPININPATQYLLSKENEDMELKGDDDNDDDSDSNDNLNANNYNKKHQQKAEYEYGVESDSDESVPSIEYRLSFKKALQVFCFFCVFSIWWQLTELQTYKKTKHSAAKCVEIRDIFRIFEGG